MSKAVVVALVLSSSLVAAQPAPPPEPGTQPDETAETLNNLKRQNELLDQKLKALDDELEHKVKALQERLETAEHKTTDPEPKPKDRTSLFKIPEWVTGLRLTSDLRLRYDEIHAPDSAFVTRRRYRPRLRLGGIATLADDFEIGFRLASAPTVVKDSGGDPLSTNQSFEDNASRKPVGVDWAFVRWTPLHLAKVTGSIALGKLENPPSFTEEVFDVDYTPEGAAEVLSFKLHANHTANFYFGQFILDELAFSKNDPFLLVEQLRLDSKWSKQVATRRHRGRFEHRPRGGPDHRERPRLQPRQHARRQWAR